MYLPINFLNIHRYVLKLIYNFLNIQHKVDIMMNIDVCESNYIDDMGYTEGISLESLGGSIASHQKHQQILKR